MSQQSRKSVRTILSKHPNQDLHSYIDSAKHTIEGIDEQSYDTIQTKISQVKIKQISKRQKRHNKVDPLSNANISIEAGGISINAVTTPDESQKSKYDHGSSRMEGLSAFTSVTLGNNIRIQDLNNKQSSIKSTDSSLQGTRWRQQGFGNSSKFVANGNLIRTLEQTMETTHNKQNVFMSMPYSKDHILRQPQTKLNSRQISPYHIISPNSFSLFNSSRQGNASFPLGTVTSELGRTRATDNEGNQFIVAPSMANAAMMRSEYLVNNINRSRHDSIDREREFKHLKYKKPDEIMSRNLSVMKRRREIQAAKEQSFFENFSKTQERFDLQDQRHKAAQKAILSTQRFSIMFQEKANFENSPDEKSIAGSSEMVNLKTSMQNTGMHNTARFQLEDTQGMDQMIGTVDITESNSSERHKEVKLPKNRHQSQSETRNIHQASTRVSRQTYDPQEINKCLNKEISRLQKSTRPSDFSIQIKEAFLTKRDKSEDLWKFNKTIYRAKTDLEGPLAQNEILANFKEIAKSGVKSHKTVKFDKEQSISLNFNSGLGTIALKGKGDRVGNLIQQISNNAVNQVQLGRYKTIGDKRSEITKKLGTYEHIGLTSLPKIVAEETPREIKTISFRPVEVKLEEESSVAQVSINKKNGQPSFFGFSNDKNQKFSKNNLQSNNSSSKNISNLTKHSPRDGDRFNPVVEQNEFTDSEEFEIDGIEDMIPEQIQLIKKQRKLWKKYSINPDVEKILYKIDGIINDRHAKELEDIKETLVKTLEKIRLGKKTTSKVFDMTEFIEECSNYDFDKNYFDWEQEAFVNQSAEKIKSQRDAKKKAVDPNSMSTFSIQTQPQIVVEILKEIFPEKALSTRAKVKMNKCNCRVKNYLKQFIRYLRAYPNDYLKQKEMIRNHEYSDLCIHNCNPSQDQHTNLVTLTWFENFIKKLKIDKARQKVFKKDIFRKFVANMVQNPEIQPKLMQMRDWLRDSGLMSKTNIDFTDLHKYNQSMALKLKKPEKLDAHLKQEIQLTNYSDSSSENMEEGQSTLNFAKQGILKRKTMRLDASQSIKDQIAIGINERNIEKQQKGLQSKKENERVQVYNTFQERQYKHADSEERTEMLKKPVLDVVFDMNIKVNRNLYQNFIKAVAGQDAPQKENKDSENSSDEEENFGQGLKPLNQDLGIDKQKFAEYELITEERFQTSLLDSLKATLDNFKEVRNMNGERIQQQKKTGEVDLTAKALPSLNFVKEVLASNMDDEVQLQKEKIKRQKKRLEDKKSFEISSLKNNGEQHIMESRIDRETFYQKAKQLVGHPHNKCLENEKTLTGYYTFCKKRNIIPDPNIFKIVQNNTIRIDQEFMGDDKMDALLEILSQGIKLSLQEYEINKLYIDDQSMTDVKIAQILKCIRPQERLQSIILRNCHVEKDTMEILNDFLNLTQPINIQELRIENLKELDQKISLQEKLIEGIDAALYIKVVSIQSFDLNSPSMIECLKNLIDQNNNLIEFCIKDCKISLENMGLLIKSLAGNESIKTLSFSGITCFNQNFYGDVLEMSRILRKKECDAVLEGLGEFIRTSKLLQHLDLSNMMIGDRIVLLSEAIRKSRTLLSVHLGGNELSQNNLQKLMVQFGIDYNSFPKEILLLTDLANLDGRESKLQSIQSSLGIQKKSQHVSPDKDQKPKPLRSEQAYIQHVLTQEHRSKLKESVGIEKQVEKLEKNIVLSRKLGKCALIYNQNLQQQPSVRPNHLFYGDLYANWSLQTDHTQCYVCQKFNFVKLFYRRNDHSAFFKPVTDEKIKQRLKNNIPDDNLADPFSKLPILFGSFLQDGVNCTKIISAKHSSFLIWAKNHTIAKKKEDIKQNLLKNLQAGAFWLIHQDLGLTDQSTFDQIELSLSNWREQLLPELQNQNELVLNTPYFDKNRETEDDIFVFMGYVKPGVHTVYIYDPVTEDFLQSPSIVVQARNNKGLTLNNIDEQIVTNQNTKYFDSVQNMNTVRSHLYKDLPYDFKQQVSYLAFKKDFTNDVIDQVKTITKESDSFLSLVKDNYRYVLMLWKTIHLICSTNGPNQESEVTKESLMEIVDSIIKQNYRAAFEEQVAELKEKVGEFSRKDVTIFLLRLAQRIVLEKNNIKRSGSKWQLLAKKVNNNEYKTEREFEELLLAIVEKMSKPDSNILVARDNLVFYNKPLLKMLNENYDHIYNLFHYFTDKTLSEFTFSDSLNQFMHAIKNVKVLQAIKNPNTVYLLCLQSQNSLTLSPSTLSRHEFIMFLINCAVHLQVEKPQTSQRRTPTPGISPWNSQADVSEQDGLTPQAINPNSQYVLLKTQLINSSSGQAILTKLVADLLQTLTKLTLKQDIIQPNFEESIPRRSSILAEDQDADPVAIAVERTNKTPNLNMLLEMQESKLFNGYDN